MLETGTDLEELKGMKTIQAFLLLISTLMVFHAHAEEQVPYLVCDRAIIRQAIQVSKAKVKNTHFPLRSRQEMSPDLKLGLSALKLIENKIFRKSIFNLGHDFIPGASISGTTISIFPETLNALKTRLEDPFQGNLFLIAHEIAHMVQNDWQAMTQSPLSPHGLKNIANSDESFNIMHSETDCIGVELMKEAGYKSHSEVMKSLELIYEDCLFVREKSFCDQAHRIRTKTVESFLKNY